MRNNNRIIYNTTQRDAGMSYFQIKKNCDKIVIETIETKVK
jgi:hypothetical protein